MDGLVLWLRFMFLIGSHLHNDGGDTFVPGPGEVPWPVMSERPDHYFSADPASPEERQQVRVRLDGRGSP